MICDDNVSHISKGEFGTSIRSGRDLVAEDNVDLPLLFMNTLPQIKKAGFAGGVNMTTLEGTSGRLVGNAYVFAKLLVYWSPRVVYIYTRYI